MTYDVTVIGSGPGGYVAAIRASQLGFKTAIIEKDPTLGGTCLNVGCIPSKALLDSSEHYYNARKTFETHGIKIKDLEVDMPQMIKRKADVVDQNTSGIRFLMKKNNIDEINGWASFIDKNTIKVTKDNGETQEVKTNKVIIATGSDPRPLPNIEFDGQRIISSTEALEITEVPKTMVIIGAGVIATELGSVYARLGTEVTMIEYLDAAIPTMDRTMSKELTRSLKKIGIKFHFSHRVTNIVNKGDHTEITAINKKEEEVKFTGDYCLVAIGRRPFTEGLGLENIGIQTERGQIPVDDHLQTSVPGVYAIGDVIKGAMLAHKAEEEGVFVAETLAGQKPHVNYLLIPGVVYTWPEVASVGYTEEQLKENNKTYKVGTFPYRALGRSRASMDIEGLVKILADKTTDEILGVHIIGARAADMIMEGVLAMEYKASAEDIARMSHPHPTYTEAFKEACLAATENRPIHM
ncbi:MAG TPA: dihydrolipoyl dehydrogenase [Microscillaceae bacterium]|nr:dihydrolipoyl dehydrogenase [Microscillaceae bacterium]